MRTKEFIKRVEELGFKVGINGGTACVLKNDYTTIMRVEVDKTSAADCFYLSNRSLEEEIREKLFDLLVEYAKTPIEDREEEKRFLVQHKFLVSVGSNPVNLVKYKDKNNYRVIRCLLDNQFYQARFTLKEVEEIKKKFDTDLKDFELVEVEE